MNRWWQRERTREMEIKRSRTIIIIPARGGSKRLPRKNLLPLDGKPLIHHAVDVARGAGPFGSILISTDDQEIANYVSNIEDVSIDKRDPRLAGDKIKVVDVILELCKRPYVIENFDIVGMLLPTCPLRSVEDVRSGFEMMDEKLDAVISFTKYEFSPLCAVSLNNDNEMKVVYEPSPLITGKTRSQDQAPTYRPNGAFFFSWIQSLTQLKSFYSGKVKGYAMPRSRSIDIDKREDFDLAEWFIQNTKQNS